MYLHTSLYFLSILLWASVISDGKKICNTYGDICEQLVDQDDALEEISRWWQLMSEKKPLKCHGKAVIERDLLQDSAKVIFHTGPCSEYLAFGSREKFSFKGKIENARFEGPGKFKLGSFDEEGHTEGICFKSHAIAGQNITSIVGNFVEGRPHGIVKIELSGGSVHIGRLQNGVRHGFYRHWDTNGNLEEVGYHYNGKATGRLWQGVQVEGKGNYSVRYSPTAVLDPKTDQILDSPEVVIFGRNFRHAIAGELLHSVITRARYADVVSTDIQDCFMTLKWHKKQGKTFKYQWLSDEIRYYQGEREPYPHCPLTKDWDQENFKEEIIRWARNLTSFDFDALWKIEPLPEPVKESARRVLEELEQVDGNTFQANLFGSGHKIPLRVKRHQQKHEKVLDGYATVFIDDQSQCPKIPLLDKTFSRIDGFFEKGLLQGTAVFKMNDTSHLSVKMKDGVMHGTAVKLGVGPVFPLAKEYPKEHKDLHFQALGYIGTFRQGRPEGPTWIATIGDGFLYGVLDKEGRFTGNEMAFIYPDMETAIFGRYENAVLKGGRKSRVVAQNCDERGIKVLQFAPPEGPEMFFSPPTNSSYGEGPRNKDPYEEKFIRLEKSQVEAAGEGVFAIKDIPKDRLACPYAGIVYRNKEELQIYLDRYTQNKSLSDYERRWSTKYSIGVGYTGAKIEIPIDMDVPGDWMPTTAQKINCDFPERKMNVMFSHFDHPRFGLIMGAFATRDIKAGEELFADYGYKKSDFPWDFPWYHEEKEKYLKELKEKRERETKMEEQKAVKQKSKKKRKKSK